MPEFLSRRGYLPETEMTVKKIMWQNGNININKLPILEVISSNGSKKTYRSL